MFKSTFEKPAKGEKRQEKFAELIKNIAAETNEYLNRFIEDERGKNIVGEDGHIEMRSFWTKKGGPFAKTGEGSVSEDEDFVLERRKIFSGIWNDDGKEDKNIKDYYRDTFNCGTEEEMVKQWSKNQEKSYGALLEKALLSILYKALRKDFIVVHSSVYDDYANGVDYVIVNKETGDVACAFDGVNDDKGGERFEKKIKKIRDKSKKDGAVLKYGITFEKSDGGKKLVKKELSGIPVFCLSISRDELDKLLGKMNYDLSGGLSDEEAEVFGNLIELLKSQTADLEHAGLSEKVKDNLAKFKISLAKMEESAAKKRN
ncbi:MAG: hypothetical protein PHD51_01845 [Patescibacteria group bacterium]|nr:hypothetical protein [Patescibacteria group bacterium]MDD5490395.1 hypothetical protein [Patescibacteria group bacterium]